MGKPVGSLIVRIGADSGGLTKAGRRVEGTLNSMQRSAGRASRRMAMFGSVAAGVAATVGGTLVRAQLNAVQSVRRLNEVTGFQIKTIQAAGVEARKYGVSQERAADALTDFSERLGEARQGTGEALDGFKMLERASGRQIDIQQNVNDVWDDFLAAMGEVDDKSTRAAVAAQIGGDALRDMIPALSGGAEGMREAAKQAEAFGFAMNKIDVQQTEKAQQAISTLGTRLEGITQRVTIELAPAISAITGAFDSASESSGSLKENIQEATRGAISGFASVLEGAASIADFISQNPMMSKFGLVGFVMFGKRGAIVGSLVGKIFAGVERSMASLGVTTNDTQAKFFNLSGELNKARETLDSLEKKNDKYAGQMKARLQPRLEQQRELVARLEGELAKVADKMGAKEFEDFTEQFNRGADSTNMLSEGLHKVADQLRNLPEAGGEERFVGAVGQLAQLQGGGEGEQDTEQREKETKKRREFLQQRLEDIRKAGMSQLEIEREQFEKRMEWLREAKEREILTEKQYRTRVEELEKSHQKKMRDLRQKDMKSTTQLVANYFGNQTGTMLQEFRTQISALAEHNKTAFKIQKAFAISDAIVSAYRGISRTLATYPYPVNLGFAALHAAVAFKKVQAIKSQSFGGGGAGSTALPGSSAAKAPAQQGAGGGGAEQGGPQKQANITIRGDNFSGDAVASLAEQLGEFWGDGGGGRVNVRRAT